MRLETLHSLTERTNHLTFLQSRLPVFLAIAVSLGITACSGGSTSTAVPTVKPAGNVLRFTQFSAATVPKEMTQALSKRLSSKPPSGGIHTFAVTAPTPAPPTSFTDFFVVGAVSVTPTTTMTFTSTGAGCLPLNSNYNPARGPVYAALYNMRTGEIELNIAGPATVDAQGQACFTDHRLDPPETLFAGVTYTVGLYQIESEVKLVSFAELGATATVTGANSGTLSVPAGGDAGFYFNNGRNLIGTPLANLGPISFDFSGTGATGGSPRFSIPYSVGGGPTQYAVSSASNCPGIVTGAVGNTTFSSGTVSSPPCTVYDGNGLPYPSFAALAAANPGAVVSGLPFIVVDEPGNFTITNIHLGQ